MQKPYRSLIAKAIAPSALAGIALVNGPTAQAQHYNSPASIQPVPLFFSSISGGHSFQLVATGGATSGTSGPGATATNWDNSGNYFYQTGAGLGTSTGTYGGYWGIGKSTSTNYGAVNSGGVTLNTYFFSNAGGSVCSNCQGGNAYDNFPVYYYQSTGLQIGSGGGTGTWNLASQSQGYWNHIYFATSGGSGATGINWVFHYSNGGSASGSFSVADWASGSAGSVSGPYSYGNGGYWQGSGNQNRYIYQYEVNNPDPSLTLTSIDITRNGGTNLNVLAISASGFTPAPPGVVMISGGVGLTSVSLLRIRRRKRRA